jgi:5-methylcytosine-specific restriction endonuclease McrA
MAGTSFICESVSASTRVVLATCKECESPFKYEHVGRKPGRPREFCSKNCSARFHYRRSYRKNGTKNWRRHTFNCQVCLKPFETYNRRTVTCGISCGGKLGVANALQRGTRPKGVFASDNERWRHFTHSRRAKIKGQEKFPSTEIYERDGYRCGLCGGKIDRRTKWPHPRSASLDHIKPISEGGEHSRVNVQCAHLGCNSKKHAGAGGQHRLFG